MLKMAIQPIVHYGSFGIQFDIYPYHDLFITTLDVQIFKSSQVNVGVWFWLGLHVHHHSNDDNSWEKVLKTSIFGAGCYTLKLLSNFSIPGMLYDGVNHAFSVILKQGGIVYRYGTSKISTLASNYDMALYEGSNINSYCVERVDL